MWELYVLYCYLLQTYSINWLFFFIPARENFSMICWKIRSVIMPNTTNYLLHMECACQFTIYAVHLSWISAFAIFVQAQLSIAEWAEYRKEKRCCSTYCNFFEKSVPDRMGTILLVNRPITGYLNFLLNDFSYQRLEYLIVINSLVRNTNEERVTELNNRWDCNCKADPSLWSAYHQSSLPFSHVSWSIDQKHDRLNAII